MIIFLMYRHFIYFYKKNMFTRHSNKPQYFNEQAHTTEKYVIPFISDILPVVAGMKVLEIGCAEGGNMLPFLDAGCQVIGLDIAEHRIKLAEEFFAGHPLRHNLRLIVADIYEAEHLLDTDHELIIMRDVIEHIPQQEKLMAAIKKYMAPHGKLFIAFPPWYNPFGGHQQVCANKFVSLLPYIHLLPASLYKAVLQMAGESEEKIHNLLELRKTGISIERFRKIVFTENYIIHKETLYLINPNYEVKFRLKPRRQLLLIRIMPFVRNFFTTVVYYVLSKK